MSTAEDTARAELRARQGGGARYDAPAAPARELSWARRGTAYFARLLNDMTTTDLDGPSRIPGWTRRHVVAHVSYNARAIALFAESIRAGTPARLYPSLADRQAEISLAATLPDRALRHLFQHSEVHLNVEWRDLTDAEWDAAGTDLLGRPLPVRQTPWLRARELWVHALDLGTGGRVQDLPPDVMRALTAETGAALTARLAGGCLPYAPEGAKDTSQAQDWPF